MSLTRRSTSAFVVPKGTCPLSSRPEQSPAAHAHARGRGDHGHTHGVVDASIPTTTQGTSAIKRSFVILAATAILQLAVVYFSSSVAGKYPLPSGTSVANRSAAPVDVTDGCG